MGGRGTFASGNQVPFTYKTIGFIEDAKILKGISSKYHKLPEEAHSSEKYIKLNTDGSFKMLRIYGKDHYLKLEIAYQYEGNLKNDKNGKVLHYHEYGKDFSRTKAKPITKEMYNKYKKYLKGVKLYD